MVDDGKPKPVLTESASTREMGADLVRGTRTEARCRFSVLRERKWRLAVLSICILGMIIILIIALIIQIFGRLPDSSVHLQKVTPGLRH